jgi:uncharacterized membrane protein YhaH (DUF805 family)
LAVLAAAVLRPGLLTDTQLLAALIGLQGLLFCVWDYRHRMFPVLMIVFVLSGTAAPFRSIWIVGRWAVLGVSAAAGVATYARDRTQHFRPFHLVALFCVIGAVASGMVSSYPSLALAKSLSLFLLFLYGSTGVRAAIRGMERQFFSGLLTVVEVMVCFTVISYALGYQFWGNPNSLGAVVGVAMIPLLLWGLVTAEGASQRRRRGFILCLAFAMLFFSLARAAIFGSAAACVALLIASRNYRLLVRGIAVAGVIAVVILTVRPRLSDERAGSVASLLLYKGKQNAGILGSRQSPWAQTMEVIQTNPWFGSGFGTSITAQEENNEITHSYSSRASREHGDSYLAITEWVGLAGVIPFAALVLLVAINAARVMAEVRRSHDLYRTGIPVALMMIAGLVHAGFEDWLFAVGYYLCVFFWTMAFLLVDFVPQAVRSRFPSIPRHKFSDLGEGVSSL